MWFFFPQWIILGLCLLSSNYLLRLLHVARPGMEDHQAHEKERRLDFHLCPALFLTSFWQIWGMENSLVSLHSTLYLNTWFKNISSVLKKKKKSFEREREKTFYPLAYSPDGCKGLPEALSQEPGFSSGSTTWVQGPKLLSHVLLLSQARYHGAGSEVESLELQLMPIWDASTVGES